MSQTVSLQTPDLAKAHVPSADIQGTPAEMKAGEGHMNPVSSHGSAGGEKSPAAGEFHHHSRASDDGHSSETDSLSDKPTDEELRTLRRVAGHIKWQVWTIAFAELCERFSYYGSAVLYTNFVQRPLPPGSTTGASEGTPARIPGALNMGQRASTGLGLFNQFFAYLLPLLG